MSRSYKKNPGFSRRMRWAKKEANKKVRRARDVADGKQYRKLYDLWWSEHNATYIQTWKAYWLDQLESWKRRNELVWGHPRGYHADYHFLNRQDHWTQQNPELHKEKHWAKWKKDYKCK